MTQRTCIAIADATRARLFIHEREATAERTRDELVEHAALVNPARHLTANDQVDDGFARLLTEQIEALAANTRARRIVVCASPHMLGRVRRYLVRPRGTTCDELPKDLVQLGPTELRAQLAAHGMLPPLPERASVP
ncbi:MAG TPA: host attachment protein [Kofleriaceae bacterium]|nr:host attachment protein [Kofleriaceae bacterium]